MAVFSSHSQYPACQARCHRGSTSVSFVCLASAARHRNWRHHLQRCSAVQVGHTTQVVEPSLSSSSVPQESAADFLAKGKDAIESGHCHEGIRLLLRAQRIAAKQVERGSSGMAPAEFTNNVSAYKVAEEASKSVARAYERWPSLLPVKANREGSLLLLEPAGSGKCHPPAFACGSEPQAKQRQQAQSSNANHKYRYEPWLCGGEIPRVDCADDAGLQKALHYVARRVPVVMTNLDLIPRSAKWNVEYFQNHTTAWPGMTVLKSAANENRYLYYFAEQSDRDMAAFQGAPRHASQEFRMSFNGFLREAQNNPGLKHYLQAPLVIREGNEHGVVQEKWCAGIDETLRNDCDRDLNRHRLQKLEASGRFGHWSRSQLFVGPNETLSPIHYDQYDNIYLQVTGEKHFLVFDPRAAEGLYPFPLSHPYDEYAMLDLEHVDHRTFVAARDCLNGRGACTTLRPGESLYIPTHWWHHVQGIASNGSWSISVNFWYTIFRDMCRPPHPLPLHLELELARHAELLLSDICGSAAVGSIIAALVADVNCEGEPSKDLVSLPARNFLLFRLARLLGAQSVCSFVLSNFPHQRFDRACVQRALQGPQRGARERIN